MEPKRFVLLVEDNQNDELLARRAFQKCGFSERLLVTRDGAEALDFLFGRGKHAARDARHLPSLVLLDLKLPKIDGSEVLRQVRADEALREVPVVVLSSSDEKSDQQSSLELGANGYLRKPVEFRQFVETVRQLSLCWLQADGTLGRSNDEQH